MTQIRLPGEPTLQATRALPLVVDLDGTLISNDLLHETASRFLSLHPLRCAQLAVWLVQGRAKLKRELWAAAPVNVVHLAYHQGLLTWLSDERDQGRTIVLASACDQAAAQAVADHLGIFDLVLASDGVSDLRSRAKAEALLSRFGEQGFEYVGNHRHDLAVWRHAAAAHVVGSNSTLTAKARRVTPDGRTFLLQHRALGSWVKALRPHQWVKNLLIVLPLLTAHRVTEMASVVATALAVVSFCLAASSVYLLNDIADVEHDRVHPSKRFRPFAAGTASLATGWLVWPALAAAALGLGFSVTPSLGLVLLAYLFTTTAYSFALKRKPVIDVVTLALLYTIRIAAGAAAIDVPLSKWLLSFSTFFFLSLALVKRVSELSRNRLSQTKVDGRGYRLDDLELLSSYGVTTSVTSVLVFTLFINDPDTAVLYRSPSLLSGSIPIIFAWLMRVWLLAHRGEMNEDPIVFALKDRTSFLCGALVVGIFMLATFYPK
jgi:4-hydroxybenzoate polyprenyltransferase/phosphoserine phosphatase